MQEVFEEIRKAIHNDRYNSGRCEGDYTDGWRDAMRGAEYIVERLEIEYNNGWIPVTERLPEEYDTIFAKYKGTASWNDRMFERVSDIVCVTIVRENGEIQVTTMCTIDGKWKSMIGEENVVAWQPLPEAFI